jgi:hypothetical protein
MRSAECQVAAAVAARSMGVAASGPLRLAGSGQQALGEFVRLRGDLDQLPAFAHLVRGLAAFHLLLHRNERSHRDPLYPTGTSLQTVLSVFATFITGLLVSSMTASDAVRHFSLAADFFWDHLFIPPIPASMAIITAMVRQRRSSQWL